MQKVSLVLGIRPDVIRASIIIDLLRTELGSDGFEFIWSGQHYSDNMKDIFFRQLQIGAPDVELPTRVNSDTQTIGSLIEGLGSYWTENRPEAAVFLGDTNTVCGSIAAASLNIPILHIEGCMRSYDWRMPEEKYRTSIDHLSDVIYAYLPEYKAQGLAEGLSPDNILVTGNPIVDVIDQYFFSGRIRLTDGELSALKSSLGMLGYHHHWVMTCHRRENVESRHSLSRILRLAGQVGDLVIFPAGFKTQRKILEYKLAVPPNVQLVDPIGYAELLELMSSAVGILTDSGTIVEEAAILGVPSVQMRTATERPQVYDAGGSVKFDPHSDDFDEPETMSKILKVVRERTELDWNHGLGDGHASTRIAEDIVKRLKGESWAGHLPKLDSPLVARNFGLGNNNLGAF